MQLTTTTKYAIQILGLMAQNKTIKYSSKQLSDELNIPYKYLAKIMTKLTKSEIVLSSRGKFGGFTIIKNIKDIKIIDIAIVFDNIDNKKCVLADVSCDFEQKCIVHDKWEKPRCAIDDFFTKTTLFELIKQSSLIETIHT
ncbi:MAG: Rrf2 family transcriptional regulator [Campylobacterota bacterium]|nr:Rrf2 family transcriptional regulator [Campylobacterota bacterium]